jgi:cytochrome c biogenesis factor
MKKIISEILISIILISLTLTLVDPFMYWMPSQSEKVILLLVVFVFIAYAAFFWKERVVDEREERRRMEVSRSSWLTGVAVLVVGLLIEGLSGIVDPWLVYSLSAMVLAKAVTSLYFNLKNK